MHVRVEFRVSATWRSGEELPVLTTTERETADAYFEMREKNSSIASVTFRRVEIFERVVEERVSVRKEA
jgi:hypothetical protein